jgi:hypothetical protein
MLDIMFALSVVAIQAGSPARTPAGQAPRFTYVLPENFKGWACVDFGVSAAAPLLVRDDGSYQVDVQRGIVSTSSLPHLSTSPTDVKILQLVDGRLLPAPESLAHRSTRHQTDTNSPISRHCLFLGTAEEARTIRRPPTLYESTLRNIGDIPERFEFVQGTLADFADVSRVCVDARDSDRRVILRSAAAGFKQGAEAIVKCSHSFRGIQIRFEPGRSIYTHSSARGELFGFGEVKRDHDQKADALVVWLDDEPGTATDLAGRFGRALGELFARAAAAAREH